MRVLDKETSHKGKYSAALEPVNLQTGCFVVKALRQDNDLSIQTRQECSGKGTVEALIEFALSCMQVVFT